MTTAIFAPSRPDVHARLGGRSANTLSALKKAWSDHLAYRRAFAQLRALDIRQREDLGIAGFEPKAVARAAVYGN